MALELFDVALNEIISLKTELYALFPNLIEGNNSPVKKAPLQRSKSQLKRSKTTTPMEVESSKKNLSSAMEQEQRTPLKAQSDNDLVIFINESGQKAAKDNTSQVEMTPPSTGTSKKRDSPIVTPVGTRSKGTPVTQLRATKSTTQKKIGNKSNPIQKMDVRVTRSKSLKKRSSQRVKALLGSKKK